MISYRWSKTDCTCICRDRNNVNNVNWWVPKISLFGYQRQQKGLQRYWKYHIKTWIINNDLFTFKSLNPYFYSILTNQLIIIWMSTRVSQNGTLNEICNARIAMRQKNLSLFLICRREIIFAKCYIYFVYFLALLIFYIET